MNKFWFTWGSGQKYPNCYTIVEAVDETTARAMMTARFGYRWSMMYGTAESCGIDEFGLRLVPFESAPEPCEDAFRKALAALLDVSRLRRQDREYLSTVAVATATQVTALTVFERATIRALHEQYFNAGF
jgi:hypothetical protein